MLCKIKSQCEVLGWSTYTNVDRVLYCRISLFFTCSYSSSIYWETFYVLFIQRELYFMRQIGEMLTTVDSTCEFLINKPDTVMSFKALRKAIKLSGIPSILICTDIAKITVWSISRLLNIIELNLFSKWKHVECNHTTQAFNEYLLFLALC